MTTESDNYATNITLLQRLKFQHDEKSWEEFVYYYQRFIYIICRKQGMAHHDAEEVVQKVLLKIWDKLPTFQYNKNKKFRSWLFLVTKNTALDYIRKQMRDSALETKVEHDDVWKLDSNTSDPAIDTYVENEWECYLANKALQNIQDSFSEKVISVFKRLTEGKKPKDISEEYGLSTITVSVYKQRVTEKLRDEIKRLKRELD